MAYTDFQGVTPFQGENDVEIQRQEHSVKDEVRRLAEQLPEMAIGTM